ERVDEDAVQPRPQVRAGLELPEGGVRLGERFLDQIFGVCGVAGHAQRRGIQPLQVRQRVPLEPHGPLPRRFGGRHGSGQAGVHAVPDAYGRAGRRMPVAVAWYTGRSTSQAQRTSNVVRARMASLTSAPRVGRSRICAPWVSLSAIARAKMLGLVVTPTTWLSAASAARPETGGSRLRSSRPVRPPARLRA